MKIGILGTGMVGNALGTKLVQVGNEVMLGSRDANNQAAHTWASALGPRAHSAKLSRCCQFWRGRDQLYPAARIPSTRLSWSAREPLRGKILIDVSQIRCRQPMTAPSSWRFAILIHWVSGFNKPFRRPWW